MDESGPGSGSPDRRAAGGWLSSIAENSRPAQEADACIPKGQKPDTRSAFYGAKFIGQH